jgi:C-terminal processing protease CtpA/Prc
VYPGGPAERAGVNAGDVVERVNGEPPVQLGRLPLLDLTDRATSLMLRRADHAPAQVRLEPSTYSVTQVPSGGTLAHDVRCIAIPPATKGMAHPYLRAAHQVIRQFERLPSSGWVVDLRLNLGGDLYLMLAAIAPILGDGDVGGLVDARGRRRPWRCQDGNVYLGNRRRVRVDDPVRLKGALPAVAVLTSRLTASAAEGVVAAFSGRPRTRRFGEPTAGLATGLEDKKLRDGGIVRCSTSIFSDRTGRAQCGPLEPDTPVAADWRRFGADGDPVLAAAVEWLRTLPADGSPAPRE